MSRTLKLGPARDFERDWIIDLWRDQFGRQGNEETVVTNALNQNHGGVWCYTIGSQEHLLAFAIITRFPIEQFDDIYANVDTSEWPKAATNGNIYMICVADEAQNHGYATKLIRRSYTYFWRNDIRRIWATCWHRTDHVDSRLLFDSLGYEQLATDPHYYQTPEDEPDRHCPDCGIGCSCTASHWTTVITEDDVDDP